jgi:hypothetical protein
VEGRWRKMEQVKVKKTVTIEVDVVSGGIEVMNNDEMSYIEIIGALEYAKMMYYKEWIEL